MTIDDILGRIRDLRNEVLEVARESINFGEVAMFNKLNEVAVIMTELSSSNGGAKLQPGMKEIGGKSIDRQSLAIRTSLGIDPTLRSSTSQIIPVFASYRGTRHEGELDTSRIRITGRGECIKFGGNWMTPGKATSLINTNRPSGWRFWRYVRTDGTEGRIQEIRESLSLTEAHIRPVISRSHGASGSIRSTIHRVLSAESPLHRKVILERVLEQGHEVGVKIP